MFRVSTTPIIRSTQNCNYSLRYCAATSLQRGQASLLVKASLVTLEGGSCTLPEAVVTVLCTPNLSSGLHKTITTASSTGHIFCATTSLQRGQAWPRWRKVAAQNI